MSNDKFQMEVTGFVDSDCKNNHSLYATKFLKDKAYIQIISFLVLFPSGSSQKALMIKTNEGFCFLNIVYKGGSPSTILAL